MIGSFRYLLASMVLLSHLNVPIWDFGFFKINQGVFAVFCFYIISGYFTALIFDRFKDGPNVVLEFYRDRLFRIMPAFLTVMMSVIFLNLIWFEPSFGLRYSDFLTFKNWYQGFMQPLNGVFSFFLRPDFPGGAFSDFTPYPSLALEVKFFVVFPLFVRLSTKYVWASIVIGLMLVLDAAFQSNPNVLESVTYRYLMSTLPLFLFGYILFLNNKQKIKVPLDLRLISGAIGIFLLLVLVFKSSPGTNWLGEMAFAFIFCPIVFNITMKYKPSKLDQIAGYSSYGIFLTHIPVMHFLHIKRSGYESFFDGLDEFLIALTVSTTISLLIYYFIEKPVIKIRHKKSSIVDVPEIQLATT